jgi:excisionase family DNA binding protein
MTDTTTEPAATEPPAYTLTTADVARRLSVTPSTVRRWADDGALPAIKPGRAYRFNAADVDEFLTASSTSTRRSLVINPHAGRALGHRAVTR